MTSPDRMRLQVSDAAAAVGGVELADAGAPVVEQQVGMAVAAKITRDDQIPARSPVRIRPQLLDGAAVGRIELPRSGLAIVEEEVGPAAAAEIAWHDDVPRRAPAWLRAQEPDSSRAVGGVELAVAGALVVEQQVRAPSPPKLPGMIECQLFLQLLCPRNRVIAPDPFVE